MIPDIDALVAKLTREVPSGEYAVGGGTVSYDGRTSQWGGERIMALANPDGPEAAATLTALSDEIAVLKEREAITLSRAEIQSKHDRVKWAEGLILQLPADHDGRNSWLLNYGRSDDAQERQAQRGLVWNDELRCAALTDKAGS